MVKRRKTGTTGGNQKSSLQRATPLLHIDNQRLHLTIREVEQLLQATKGSRNEDRDRCLVLLAFRHGLRVSEACHLNLDQVDIYSRVLHVHRLKNGLSTGPSLARGRVAYDHRLAEGTGADEGAHQREGVLRQ